MPSPRTKNDSMELFDAPSIANELMSKPVQEFWMRGVLSLPAKVTGGGHKALTEMLLPNAVDENTRGQRVVRIRNPFG